MKQVYEQCPGHAHWYFLDQDKHFSILTQVHDQLGHKGYFMMKSPLLNHFWWLMLNQDVKWFCDLWDECQRRPIAKVLLPPTVAAFSRALLILSSALKGYFFCAGCYKWGLPFCKEVGSLSRCVMHHPLHSLLTLSYAGYEQIHKNNPLADVQTLQMTQIGMRKRNHCGL